MITGRWVAYDSAVEHLADGTIDLDTHDFKVLLATAGYTPSGSHSVLADVTSEVVNGNGYLTGGQDLAKKPMLRSEDMIRFDVYDPSWTALGGFIAGIKTAVIYDDTAASKHLLCYCVFDGPPTTVTDGNDFKIWSTGVLTWPARQEDPPIGAWQRFLIQAQRFMKCRATGA